MMIPACLFSFSLLLSLSLACSEEKNPYAGAYRGQANSANSQSNQNPATGQPVPSAAEVKKVEEATKTVAKAEDIAGANVTLVQEICGSKAPELASVQAELAILCLEGQPTQAFANALKSPYKGGPNPPLVVVKNVDNNGVSEFILLSVIEIAKPITEVFPKRATLNMGNVTAGNAMLDQSVLATKAGAGAGLLDSLDIQADLTVKVGAITVDNRRISKSDALALNQDKTLIGIITALKPVDLAPDNRDDILATTLSFMMKDGNGTKMISISHQMSNNRNRHPTAEATALGLGSALMTSSYTKLSQ